MGGVYTNGNINPFLMCSNIHFLNFYGILYLIEIIFK